jgi:hypothetical protein
MENSAPAVVVSLDKSTGTEEDARAAFRGWSITEPSVKEQEAFRSAFYDPHHAESSTLLGIRSATIALILRVLESARRPLTVDEIREAMCWEPAQFKDFQMTSNMEAARQRWIVFQVKQAQRLAMEAPLSWVEERIIADGDSSTTALSSAAERACSNNIYLASGASWVRGAIPRAIFLRFI